MYAQGHRSINGKPWAGLVVSRTSTGPCGHSSERLDSIFKFASNVLCFSVRTLLTPRHLPIPQLKLKSDRQYLFSQSQGRVSPTGMVGR